MSSGNARATGPAAHGGVEGAGDVFWDTRGILNLGHPFGDLAEHLAVVDLLKRLPVPLIPRHLADEHDHGGRVLQRRVQADAAMARAGPARHHNDARLAGEFGITFGHVRRPALVPAGVEVEVLVVVERVEQGQIALPRHTECRVGTMNAQRVRQNLAAGAGVGGGGADHGRGLGSDGK
jgi:hypothetical protein